MIVLTLKFRLKHVLLKVRAPVLQADFIIWDYIDSYSSVLGDILGETMEETVWV